MPVAIVVVPHILDLAGSVREGLLQSINTACHILDGSHILLRLGVDALHCGEHCGKLVKERRGEIWWDFVSPLLLRLKLRLDELLCRLKLVILIIYRWRVV